MCLGRLDPFLAESPERKTLSRQGGSNNNSGIVQSHFLVGIEEAAAEIPTEARLLALPLNKPREASHCIPLLFKLTGLIYGVSNQNKLITI